MLPDNRVLKGKPVDVFYTIESIVEFNQKVADNYQKNIEALEKELLNLTDLQILEEEFIC